MQFNTLDEWLDWQTSLNPREIELGLSRISTVAQRLNLLSPSFPIISVAGTNGKGSSVILLDAILSAAGYRVGRYTSPHLLRYNERICIGGIEATEAQLCQAFDLIEEVRNEIALTFFEFNTLAALLVFQHNEIDLAVLEVGLGGRLDAVNIFDPEIALVTAIDIDHTDWLGHDRESIGFEKAGIFRAQRPAVCSDPNPPQRLIEHAAQLQTPLYCLGHDFTYKKNNEKTWNWQAIDKKRVFKEFEEFEEFKKFKNAHSLNLPLPRLPGDFQLQNAAGVLMTLTLLNHGKGHFFVSESAIHEGLINAKILGRFQILSGRVTRILDVAHNPASAKALADLLRQHPCQGKTHAVVGMLKDKDIAKVLAVMQENIDYWHIAPLKVPRAANPKCLFNHLETMGITHGIIFSTSITKAYQYAIAHAQEEDRVIVFGSFYTVAEVLRAETVK
jgi:dihydrofolate synthase/folylpolyglutamate synthase